MKRISLISLTIITSFLVAACSGGLQQDPLTGKPSPLKNGQPPLQKPELPEPQQSDAVRIDSADSFSFMEDREDKLVIKMRVLENNYNPELVIENLEAFEGAKFDPTTGDFFWKPSLGTVFDGLEREMQLKVSGVAYPVPNEEDLDPVVLISHKTINIKVIKKLTIPEISKVEGTPNSIREGETRMFSVFIHDPDGGINEGETPQLLIFPPAGIVKSIAHTIELSKSEYNYTTKLWELRLRLNFMREELTKSVSTAGARFQVLNRYGKMSPMVKFETLILTDLQRPDHTWRGSYELNPDVENVIQFFIFDPAREGEIALNGKPTLPQGSTLTCVREEVGLASCDFKWMPEGKNFEQNADIKIEIKNQNIDKRDTGLRTNNFTLRMKVKKKAVITPPTPPDPAPPETPAPKPPTPPGPKPPEKSPEPPGEQPVQPEPEQPDPVAPPENSDENDGRTIGQPVKVLNVGE